MARRVNELESEPSVVLIPDHYSLTMDEWLASIRTVDPINLTVSGTELVAEARNEQELRR